MKLKSLLDIDAKNGQNGYVVQKTEKYIVIYFIL